MTELEQHIDELIGLLEAEIDLHGGRTEMAHNLRNEINKLIQEKEETRV